MSVLPGDDAGDNPMVRKAIGIAKPRADCGRCGEVTNSILGECMVAMTTERGIMGFVLYGAIRDAAALHDGIMPIFAAGISHHGPYRNSPGEIYIRSPSTAW